MSLSTSLASVGRAVAYYPALSKFFGSVNASIFFSQLYYWQARSTDETGVFKTASEWTDETGLSYREQATARKILTKAGFLTETHRRLAHKVFYRLNLEVVDAAFDEWTKAQSANDESAIRETTKAHTAGEQKRNPRSDKSAAPGATKAQSVNKGKITAEITSETTAENITTEADATVEPMTVVAPNGTVYEIPADLKYPGEDTKTHKAWIAYAIAYERRYGAWPVWNAMVAGQISKFIDRVGVDNAPYVAVHYVRRVNEQFVVQQMHPVKLLLSDAEKWLTQAQTNRTVTRTEAQQADKSQSNLNTAQAAADLARQIIAKRERDDQEDAAGGGHAE